MTFHRVTLWIGLAACAALLGEAAAQSRFTTTQAALDTNTLPSGIGSPSPDLVPGAMAPGATTPGAIAPAALDPIQGSVRPQNPLRGARELHGNPLWAIPLSSLTATRERPIFVPSRRPPAPVVAGPPPVQRVRPPPPPPPEPERPRLALVGAVVGESESIAIFIDERTRDVLRLRTGENHLGWTLRSVRSREATLEKDRETMLLALPAPSETPAAPDPSGRFRGIAGAPGIPGIPGMPGVADGPRLKGPGIVPPAPQEPQL
jgi:general secretion pathway protein N